MFGCLARGNDANDVAAVALTVADEEKVGAAAHAQHEKAIFFGGVRFVVELNGKFVVEDTLGFLKGNAMLLEV